MPKKVIVPQNIVKYEEVKPLLEGAKEMGRIVLLGVLPIVLSGINVQTGEITINWFVVRATALVILTTAILKGLDKDRHLTGKLSGNKRQTKGIVGF
jgi:hypothetical protein